MGYVTNGADTAPRMGASNPPRIGGPDDSGLYSGPHYPRVLDAGGGRRTIEWNPWQTTFDVVARPPVQGALGNWPALTPGAVITEERAGFPVMYFSAQAPNASGAIVRMDYQIPLNPRAGGAMPDGLILTDARLAAMPPELLPQRDELTGGGRDTPQDDPPAVRLVWDPIARKMVDLGYRELANGQWVWADSISGPSGPYGSYSGDQVPRDRMPFGGNACFGAGAVQGPCSGDPDNATTALGTDGYETGTQGNPYRPYLDPASDWYGHPVLMEPAAPSLPPTWDPWDSPDPVVDPDPVDDGEPPLSDPSRPYDPTLPDGGPDELPGGGGGVDVPPPTGDPGGPPPSGGGGDFDPAPGPGAGPSEAGFDFLAWLLLLAAGVAVTKGKK